MPGHGTRPFRSSRFSYPIDTPGKVGPQPVVQYAGGNVSPQVLRDVVECVRVGAGTLAPVQA